MGKKRRGFEGKMFTKDEVNGVDGVNGVDDEEEEKERMLPMCRRING